MADTSTLTSDRSLANVAAVVGVGHTDWRSDYKAVREGGKPFDCYGYGAVALRRALDDAGLSRKDVDALIVGPTMSYERSAELYGLNPRWGGKEDAVQSVITAAMLIKSGLAEVVALVYGNDQLSAKVQYGGPQAMGGAANLSYVYHAPWGLTSQGALYALTFQAYKHIRGFTEQELGEVAVAQRGWSSLNPNAVMRK